MSTTFILDIPERVSKPRNAGITALVDNGFGVDHLRDVLADSHPYIDFVKLGWATAYITPTLRRKIALLLEYNIGLCPGGMLFELAYWQGKVQAYADWLDEMGIRMVEVSNGSLPIPETEKRKMVEFFAKRGLTVLSEVGSKDVTQVSPPEVWIDCIRADLDAGAWKVITEGRADASAGIYLADGSIRPDLIDRILDCPIPNEDLLFEAPHKRQMVWFIKRVGANVNLGNVPPNEVMNLETLRLGLRGDTVRHFHENHPAALQRDSL